MIKKKLISIYYIKSISLLFLSSFILAMLLSFNKYSNHSNSTGFFATNSYISYLKNNIISFLLQQFGLAIYIIPIILLIWSYQLFFNKSNKYFITKVFLLILTLLASPLALFNISKPQYSGVLGSFLNQIFCSFNNYYFILLIIIIVLLIFISGITVKDIFTCLKIITFLVVLIFNTINKYLNNIKNYFFQYWKTNISYTKSTKSKHNNLSAAFASLNKEVWNNNLSNSIQQKQSNYEENNSLEPEINKPTSLNVAALNYNNEQITQSYNINKEHLYYNKLKNQEKPSSFITNNHTQNGFINSSVNNNNNYNIPTQLLDIKEERNTITTQEIKELAIKLENVIKEFGVYGKIVNIQTGPVVTLFEISIPPGVKTSKLISLETDIALRMKAFSVRIAVVPGKDVIGIEIPNQKRKTVYLRKLLEHKTFIKSESILPLTLGLDISGKPVIADLATMPHLLVAGTTGSGKSVAVNAMILSLLYRYSPQHCKMIMIDPKMLELSIYQDIPHLLTPVVTDPKKAIYALKWAVKQMEHRYTLMSYLGVRNLSGYNQKIKDTSFIATVKNELLEKDGIELEFPFMPYIIVIIDEMADLMLVAGKEIEAAVQRLAQMARAAGIHLIMATQRPSVDVITGTIKANFPTRISFQVSSRIDSTTILGDKGAEQLLGKGDMLYMMGVGRLLRVHAPFVSDIEVEKVVNILKTNGTPEYINEITKDTETSDTSNNENELDELYNEVISLIKKEQKVSTSYIQRRFQIGYNRAARIVESLEENGVISKPSATGKREILIN